MIRRTALEARVRRALTRSPVTSLLGPRQCGKTTLAAAIARSAGSSHFFDLESDRDLSRLQHPFPALENLRGLVVLDEIQRHPALLPVLRVLADRKPSPCRFLILGSASPELIRGASETLAGRVEFVEMGGLTLPEVGPPRQTPLWHRGGFPRSLLARSWLDSRAWRENFIRTFLQRDLPQMGIRIPAPHMLRFWKMIAHTHGGIWNGAEIAGSLGVSHPTSRSHLDLLTQAYMIRQLPPWHENMGKRLVKTQKVYVRDSGILHALLGLWRPEDIEAHPKYGLSWEGFALEQILARYGQEDAYFWATHAGAELDLLLLRRGKKWGFEFKVRDDPRATKSMRIAMESLRLERLWVVHPGREGYAMDKKMDCVPLADALKFKMLD